MAFFGVTKETIASTHPIDGADRIEMAKLQNTAFQFVIQKGQFGVGDSVLYFPVDALIPKTLLEKMGLTGKLAGSKQNRVKTIRLRGQVSQGIVADMSLILDIQDQLTATFSKDEECQLITEYLGIEKYEPPVIPCQNGKLIALPVGLSAYDIEGADRYFYIANELMDVEVEITEKLEGSNFSATYSPEKNIFVNQRNFSIQPIEGNEHDYWRIAKKQGLIEFIQHLHEKHFRDSYVTVYGEFIGPNIQKNIYRLKDNEVRLFDVKINQDFLGAEQRCKLITEFFCDLAFHVPILTKPGGEPLKDWLNNRSITEASHGVSRLLKRQREGIVIKLINEMRHPELGRLILKQRDPLYLAKSEF